MRTFKFKVGDRVGYYLTDKASFFGTIAELDNDQRNKPYVIRKDDGTVGYLCQVWNWRHT